LEFQTPALVLERNKHEYERELKLINDEFEKRKAKLQKKVLEQQQQQSDPQTNNSMEFEFELEIENENPSQSENVIENDGSKVLFAGGVATAELENSARDEKEKQKRIQALEKKYSVLVGREVNRMKYENFVLQLDWFRIHSC
jgi:hypothetical protein